MSDSLPTPITRADYYLATLCGVHSGDLPAPIARGECYLATLCGTYSGELPTPITRADRYLAYLCGTYTGTLPAPITRKDYYLAALCGTYSGDLPTPIVREDYYLAQLVADGGVLYEDKTASGVTVEVTDAAAQPLNSLTLYGWSTQDGTPTPDNPIDIVSAADSGEVAVTVADGSGNSHTLILAAENGLPGIPVSSGGNYTDANGQQWIADEIVLNADGSGVYVQNVGKIILDTDTYSFVANGIYWNLIPAGNAPYAADSQDTLCNYFPGRTFYTNKNNEFLFMIEKSSYTIDDLNAYISAAREAGNPCMVYYKMDTTVETALSADEVAAFLAMKTYNGTTIITNDANAYMEVGYKAKEE